MKKIITIIAAGLLLAGGAFAGQIFGGINSTSVATATNLEAGTVVAVVDLINCTNVNATNTIGVITNGINAASIVNKTTLVNTGAVTTLGLLSATNGANLGTTTNATLTTTGLISGVAANFTGITNAGPQIIGTTLQVTGLVTALGAAKITGPVTNVGASVLGTTLQVTGAVVNLSTVMNSGVVSFATTPVFASTSVPGAVTMFPATNLPTGAATTCTWIKVTIGAGTYVIPAHLLP